MDKIKEAYKKLKLDSTSLNILFTNTKYYEAGFRSFVEGIEEVEIKSEWWDEMVDAINTLQAEVAFRQESQVRQKIVAFYVNKLKITNPTPQPGPAVPNPVPPAPTPAPQPSVDKVKQAKDKIKSINMPNMMWQRLALDLLSEKPELAEFFANLSL